MPTDTSSSRTRAVKFALRALAWSVGIFGLLRLEWVEQHGLLPLTQCQGVVATGIFGTSARPITATLACSGADVLAMCVGAILAYPVRWRTRLVGAGCGLAFILVLNTLRIGTLGRVADSPSLFNMLHVYIWPAALSLAVAGYVFTWMRLADRQHRSGSPPHPALAPAALSGERRGFLPTNRFAILAAIFLLIFAAAAPLYLQSTNVLNVAAFMARAAAAVLRFLGVAAQASANQLWTPRGSFLVTQECISTPLIPIYLAAVFAVAATWRSRIPALLAAVPLFVGLGIARLLVVALPVSLAASPANLIHAFFQIILALVVVVLAAVWRHPDKGTVVRRSLLGAGLGFSFVLILGSPYTRSVLQAVQGLGGATRAGAVGLPPADSQGAIALLPAFQVGLYLALWVAARVSFAWRKFVAGLALLGVLQMATLLALSLVAGIFATPVLVQGVRAWAIAAPLLVVALMHQLRPPDGVARPETSRK